MTKAGVEAPRSNGHPAEETVVPLGGKPVDAHVRPEGITVPSALVANALLGDLQGKAGIGSASAKAVVVEGPRQTVWEGRQGAREPARHRRARQIALPRECVEIYRGLPRRVPSTIAHCSSFEHQIHHFQSAPRRP